MRNVNGQKKQKISKRRYQKAGSRFLEGDLKPNTRLTPVFPFDLMTGCTLSERSSVTSKSLRCPNTVASTMFKPQVIRKYKAE